MIPDQIASELCRNCTKCCTTIGIPTAFRDSDEKAREFYKARGFSTHSKKGLLFLSKSDPCPHLESDGSCGIYDSRPQSCREYSCLEDIDVLGDTGWSQFLRDR